MYRLARARELLETSGLTVEAVARRCGLGTPANFRTLFKARVGVPPSVYRDTFLSVPLPPDGQSEAGADTA